MDYNSYIEVLYNPKSDPTKKGKISLFVPKIIPGKTSDNKGKVAHVNKLAEGELLFTFHYEPIFSEKEYAKICTIDIAKKLYSHLSLQYYHLYMICMKWYLYIKEVKDSFNYEIQIGKYKKCVLNQNSCPIIREIKKSELDNINFKEKFTNLIRKANTTGISDINFLLYGKKKFTISNLKNEPTSDIGNVVNNIVYERFLRFLESESQKQKNKSLRKKEYPESSLLSHLNKNQLKRIFKYLVSPNKNMIRKMELADFLNCLSGEQVIPRNRIYWLKSKSMGYDLFDKICSDFSIKKLNASVALPKGRFDSNNKPRHRYKEFDNLLKEIS